MWKNGSKASCRGIKDLGWRKGDCKVRKRSQGIGTSKVLQMDPCFWEESKWEDADEENVESCNKVEGKICVI